MKHFFNLLILSLILSIPLHHPLTISAAQDDGNIRLIGNLLRQFNKRDWNASECELRNDQRDRKWHK